MLSPKPIHIIGGGLAGLTLGIALRRRDIPVTIEEAGRYPRHRVCGEFISGRGQDTLARLGLTELMEQGGAVRAHTVSFHSATQSSPTRELPSPALCISRFKLDATLANLFRQLGGELHEGRRASAQENREGCVRATGRRPQTEDNGSRWFGMKIHARKVALTADLEMHFLSFGYIGLCKINDGEVNICGLFRKNAATESDPRKGRELLRGQPGSKLHERLAAAQWDEDSLCAVAGLQLQPQKALAIGGISVGDAITMIPPLSGNGMSMAFESAELATGPLADWSHGQSSWETARQKIARDCDTAFQSRLFWAGWLQRLVLTPAFQKPLLAFTSRFKWFGRLAFEKTR